MIIKLVILFLAFALTKVQTAKILAVFPTPSISHQVVFRKISQELVNRGHEVTVITPDPAYAKDQSPSNLKEIDVHDISYGIWKKIMAEAFKVDENNVSKFKEMRLASLVLFHVFAAQIQTPEVQKLISNKDNKFDLIYIEAVILPALAFSHIFKAPVILVSSFGAIFNSNDIVGSPSHPILYPSTLNRRLYNLTLMEKISTIYNHFSIQYANYLNKIDETALLKQILGPDIPSLSELYNNVDMFFVNVHPIWADNQPIPPGVVYMGGIHQLQEKELPKDLKLYLDSSKHGVIYVSFGTNVLAGMIPTKKIEIISNVLSKLPYDVLWKWDKDELPGKADNIKLSKWLPQSDLLRHPKILLFITQAGLQSTDEAITAGVPLVAIPMLGDQWYNAEKYVKHGIGVKLDINTFSTEEFRNAIEEIINNKRYRENIIKLRTVMRDQPETAIQRVVWWTEYVLRHGGAKHLRAPEANISYYEYLEINVVIVVFSVLFILLSLFVILSVYVFKFVGKLMKYKQTHSSKKIN